MKRLSVLLAGAALCSLPATAALADCREELASLSADNATTASVAGSSAATGTTTNFETGTTSGGAASGESEQAGQISKDGSLAPLENAGDANTAAAGSGSDTKSGTSSDMTASQSATPAEGNTTTGMSETDNTGGVSKDGQTMPMAGAQGEGEPNVAMSGQDADAQQAGQQTAAASSGQGTGNDASGSSQMASASGDGYDQAIQRAHTAMEAGDETACLAAVEEARGMQGGQNSAQ